VTVCKQKRYFSRLFVFNTLSVTKNSVTVSDSCSSVTNCHQNPLPICKVSILLKIIKIINKYRQLSLTVTIFQVTDKYLISNGLHSKKATVTEIEWGCLPFFQE
jgi:hypothetical protein